MLRRGEMSVRSWDIAVIGGGHAGVEAAHAACRMGARVVLITLREDRIGFMSCNPAIGGLAKGQLVKEIDALGGVMARVTDLAAIQYRKLNVSKGPAVQSSRAQCDKALYSMKMREFVSGIQGLDVLEAEADAVLLEGGRVVGLLLKDQVRIQVRAVVITSGTFLQARMYTGFKVEEGGRAGDSASRGLSDSLKALGFRLKRLKTGTPPRLHQRSIDWSKTSEQPGDHSPTPFSFYYAPNPFPLLPQVSCFITYTNENTHRVIERNFANSPMFSGLIQGVGPRYCPSIEDKVKRFRDRERHQVFLEPEGLESEEVYVNGVSTSLPREVQQEFIQTIPGLEQAEFIRFGYAVEYDAIECTQLSRTMGSKDVDGLYFAGQINGTSGYEEAAAQGIVAGVNAGCYIFNREFWVPSRFDSYIGVLIDDLTTKLQDEPYRMFTSRAEYRLHLREDNADLRLSPVGRELGLLSDESWRKFSSKAEEIRSGVDALKAHYFSPTEPRVQEGLERVGLPPLKDRVSAEAMLRRPQIRWNTLVEMGFESEISQTASEQAEIQVKYEGYIRRDEELMSSVIKSEAVRIPTSLSFREVSGLSNEVIQRLEVVRPETLGQASRLAGVTPAALANLMIHIKMSSKRAPELGIEHGE